jgi:hypothetical protein
MDEKDNTLLERGAANDIVRLRWRLKIRENVVARLTAENERLRNGRVESCETVACDEMSPPEDTDRRSVTSYEESDENRVNTTTNRDATPAVGSVHGDGTVGERLVERLSITQAMLDDNEKLRAEIERLRLTDEEREAIEDAAAELTPGPIADTLRNLLARLS